MSLRLKALALGLEGLPEAGSRVGGRLQDGDGLVIAKDFDGGTLFDELEVVVEVFAELGDGAVMGHGLLSL